MRNIAVREHHYINVLLADHLFEILFIDNGNPRWIQCSRESGRIASVGNVRNLGGGKSHHRVIRIVAKHDVEVVKITAGGAQNNDSLHDVIPQGKELLTLYCPVETGRGAVSLITRWSDLQPRAELNDANEQPIVTRG